jgi:hypothetical protein
MIGRLAVFLAWTVAPGSLLAIDSPPSCAGLAEFDGRHYEVVAHPGINWDKASELASGRCFSGDQQQPATAAVGQPECAGRVRGHLATITSAAEDAFLESLRQCAALKRQEVWVGGFQEPCDPDSAGCGWQWVNNEGPISTADFPLPSYSNWLADEPNNLGGKERHLGIGLGGRFGWNDEGNLGNIGGYIIEYDTSSNVSVIQCIAGDGCQTTAGQTLLLPPGVDPDGSIGVRTYEFEDPRALSMVEGERCGETALTLFTERGSEAELRIPAYLCGSPSFLVVEVQTENVQIVQGAVLVENEPILALPGNWYECDGLATPQPAPPAPLSGGDPQARDVVAWQTTNPANMRENGFLTGIPQSFVGALGEFTFECGSSRGLTRTASYFVIGMHINFGLDFADTPEAVTGQFVALTRYKLQLLQAAVEESRANRALKNGDYTKMRAMLNNALRSHDRGQFGAALKSVNQFLKFVGKANYATVPGENYQGEHLSRGRNITFMYEEKVIPSAP